jgi:CDP-diacylglycerol--glycerol-3-phosphate 3-phosphatidyltransferase
MVKFYSFQKNPGFLLFLGIVSSYSTASCSFGTNQFHWPVGGRGRLQQHTYLSSQPSNPSLPRSQKLALVLRGGAGPTIPEENARIDTDTDDSTVQEGVTTPQEVVTSETAALEQVPATATTAAATAAGGSNHKMGPNASPPGLLRKLFPSFPWHTLPNILTYARCLAIPGLMVQFYTSQHVCKNLHSALIFSIASLTDYLDGYLARRWDICSPFGAFLDPVADKLMVSTALILLSGKYGTVVAIPSAIILAREIAVSALREWMASRGQRDSVKVGFQGKCKTALTMMALTIVLAVPDANGTNVAFTSLSSLWKTVPSFGGGWEFTMALGMIMLYLSALVTVTSGSVYFRAAAPVLMGKKS